MVKELENLNDYVDGFLMTVYEEPASNLQSGKTEFLNRFRDHLAKVPSNKDGEELVKLLNRGLLKASNVSNDIGLNKRKGFEEALTSVQNKIKELFNLDDLLTGTIQQYLQDIPIITLPGKAGLPEPDEIFGESLTSESDMKGIEERLNKAGDAMRANIDAQVAVLKSHLENNGRMVVISDIGYSELDALNDNPLKGLIEGSEKSKEKLTEMLEKSKMIIKAIKKRNDQKDDGDDILRKLFGKDPED